ncbi:tetratricopeptide repeat protein [Actinopolymorpha pittospori]|uniref:Tetratricopeptide (TPR) repeat protein n=1 Tax=Actinopolymorpha pittospori TaxID=648752 RepID=A0A927N9Y7_9ACTN|nr:tetratricopeptide repeat protein [Actinopolymorpha pittospori]MBE1612943.1 tetratricopeptide (TPR) repeat protein [Actinopolymorpha pittospori]
MIDRDHLAEAKARYEQSVYTGDVSVLAAERGLDAVEADVALDRGRLLHARYLAARATEGAPPVEDPAELSLFQRATKLYASLGATRGEAEATFWIGCLYQVVRGDDETAVPHLERARDLAVRAGDAATEAEALRHLGIAAHRAGRLDQARDLLTESTRLRREIGNLSGVASNMVGLAYIASAQGETAKARTVLDEAHEIATVRSAHAVISHIEQARATLPD